MADNIEPSADEEMVAVQEQTAEEEKPTTDVEGLKKAVAEDAAKVEADESAKSGAEDESAKAANNEQDEEEEYVLKDEAHEEEDNQKENEGNDGRVTSLFPHVLVVHSIYSEQILYQLMSNLGELFAFGQ